LVNLTLRGQSWTFRIQTIVELRYSLRAKRKAHRNRLLQVVEWLPNHTKHHFGQNLGYFHFDTKVALPHIRQPLLMSLECLPFDVIEPQIEIILVGMLREIRYNYIYFDRFLWELKVPKCVRALHEGEMWRGDWPGREREGKEELVGGVIRRKRQNNIKG
jgi:hypothetical protein